MYIIMLIMLALINYCELFMQTIRVTVVDFFLSLDNTLANCVNKTLLFDSSYSMWVQFVSTFGLLVFSLISFS